jgi:spore maturation protein A
MLNYIWFGLIIIGVAVAVSLDINDISKDKYRNHQSLNIEVQFTSEPDFSQKEARDCKIIFTRSYFEKFYGLPVTKNDTIYQNAKIKFSESNRGVINILLDKNTPSFWREMSSVQGKNENQLFGQIIFLNGLSLNVKANLIPEPIKFVKVNKVTNDGAIKYAKIAVELAIGLVGIMALWLGLMKIAEQAGLIAMLAKALKPITSRLFPDVPVDHPAMGAMIMNISANMLGLGNAATPFGLKAMEELNKLSKKIGTATNAMATFLVINTSNVQLIPATVIAIRAAAGSTNPTEIIGPVIAATAINLIVGVSTCKLLEKLPMFKKQYES